MVNNKTLYFESYLL